MLAGKHLLLGRKRGMSAGAQQLQWLVLMPPTFMLVLLGQKSLVVDNPQLHKITDIVNLLLHDIDVES
jgi:hypothetical protein